MRRLSAKQNVNHPDSDFIYGRIRNNPGNGTGTPFNEELYGDIHQFFERMFAKSGLTANGVADSEYTGFQLFEAYKQAYFKTYSATISQGAGAAPVATVIENTLGTIVWSRSSAGLYVGTLTGAFTSGKVELLCQGVVQGGTVAGFYTLNNINANTINLISYDTSFNQADSILNNSHVKILVYRS